MKNIFEIAQKINIPDCSVIPYGFDKAKIDVSAFPSNFNNANGKYVLITSAVNANAAGEGKTSTEIGLNDGLNAIGVKSIACLREPSLGVCFGAKGTADGALRAKVVPESMNYHGTGDIHAMTTTVNMIAAAIDAHIYNGNELNINPDNIVWNRAIDICDRSLRDVTVAQGDKKATPHHCEFVITVAHELSTIATLAINEDDFIDKLNRAIVAYTFDNKPVTVKDLAMEKCIRILMHEALMPNLIQTLEGNPVLMSGTPFANISIGTNSVAATKLAQRLADVVLVESGFGSDLGAEKNLDLVCPVANIAPSAIVAVTSCRSLKLHGGQPKDNLTAENIEAVCAGLVNMAAHIKHLKQYKLPILVAINRFGFDTDEEINVIRNWCAENAVSCEVSEAPLKGSAGSIELAKKLMSILAEAPVTYETLYEIDEPLVTKIDKICKKCYGANNVIYSDEALAQLADYTARGYADLPIVISKTPASITDDPKVLGVPNFFDIHIREVRLFAGAGFIVPLSGSLLMLPGLGKLPRLSDNYR